MFDIVLHCSALFRAAECCFALFCFAVFRVDFVLLFGGSFWHEFAFESWSRICAEAELMSLETEASLVASCVGFSGCVAVVASAVAAAASLAAVAPSLVAVAAS